MSAGRPPLFTSDEDLKRKVEEYFFFIEGEFNIIDAPNVLTGQMEKIKDYTRPPQSPSITGLALYLGFESRQSIYDYEKKGEFSYTMKRSRLQVEAAYEQALLSKYSTGAIFALKNFGWSDKQEIDHSSTDGTMTPKTTIKFE